MVTRGGRSRPSLAYATPVHPCTMESNHRHADFQSSRVSIIYNKNKYIKSTILIGNPFENPLLFNQLWVRVSIPDQLQACSQPLRVLPQIAGLARPLWPVAALTNGDLKITRQQLHTIGHQ